MTPVYCARCGRRLHEVTEVCPIFDEQTGRRPPEVWLQCPRFPRSWRNLWHGGMGHTSTSITTPMMRREWR